MKSPKHPESVDYDSLEVVTLMRTFSPPLIFVTARGMKKVDTFNHDTYTISKTRKTSVSAGMRQRAENMGTFTHNNVTYPRLQFWQITDEYFDNPDILKQIIRLPEQWIQPRRRAERHFDDEQLRLL